MQQKQLQDVRTIIISMQIQAGKNKEHDHQDQYIENSAEGDAVKLNFRGCSRTQLYSKDSFSGKDTCSAMRRMHRSSGEQDGLDVRSLWPEAHLYKGLYRDWPAKH